MSTIIIQKSNYTVKPAFGKNSEAKPKDHIIRNTTIAAIIGGGLGYGFTKIADRLAKEGIKDAQRFKDVDRETVILRLISKTPKVKAFFAAAAAFTFSLYYLAGKTLINHFKNKKQTDSDHLGRNTLIAAAIGAVIKATNTYVNFSKKIGGYIYDIPARIMKGIKPRPIWKRSSKGAIQFALYYLAGKAIYDHLKNKPE